MKTTFQVGERKVSVYPGPSGSPAVYLNCFEDTGDRISEILKEKECQAHSLVTVCGLDWNNDMSPWYCPPSFKGDDSCGGGADAWLEVMQEKIIPEAERYLDGTPSYRAIAGYSLAGLFAVYSLYVTDVFARAASMSGSMWFPDFQKYAESHEMARKPDCLYFSLGDREARTRNPVLRTVQERTEALAEKYRGDGIETIFELNPGNHFQDPEGRVAKGIVWMLSHGGKDER